MKDYKVLKFLDIFENIFSSFDIDYKSMRKILQVKLLLDSRRTTTILNNKEEDAQEKNNFIRSLLIYLIFGIFMIPLVLLGDNYLFQMSIIFGMFIFFMVTSLISDFSSVLLDLRDKEILLSKPINDRTLNMAKILHILFYVSMMTIAIMGPALLVSLTKKGFLFFIIFLLEIILIDLFLIVFIGLIYLVILRFFDGEKLKDIINYVQIGLTIILSIGYQLIGRIFSFIDINTIKFTEKWWSYLIPPIWFASPFELVLKNNREIHIIIYSLMALIVPMISILTYIKLMPTFERNLQKLNSVGNKKRNKAARRNIIPRLICRTKEERTFYRFSTNMIKNERVFKLKVYPNLGLGLVFPFLMLFSLNMGSGFSHIQNSKMYFNMYFTFFAISVILQYLSYSGDYKGAWIYSTLPINNMEAIHKGAIKAAFINLFTPLYILVSLIFLFIFRIQVLPHIIIIYLNMMLAICIIFKINSKELPFSKAFELSQKDGIKEMMVSLITMGALFGIHFIFEKINYGVYIYLLLALIGNIIAWKYAFKTRNLVLK